MSFEHLFSPIKIGTKVSRNRIVFPCHGVPLPFFQDPEGATAYIAYQVARARGGCGLNVIGPLPIHKSGSMGGALSHAPPNPKFLVPKLRQMADGLHEHGSLGLLQLWLMGNQNMALPGNINWGFTALPAKEQRHEVCHEMDDSDINEVLDSYAKYALAAKEGGMDGVEIHACHGSLVQQSWSPWANQRKDKWGEPMVFATELINRIRAVTGRDFVLCIRMTGDDFIPGGLNNAANAIVAQALEATGKVDLLNISFAYGSSSYAYTIGTMYIPPASISVPLASGIKKAVKSIPVIACSRINEPTLAENAIADGHCDMVGLVRGQIADPEFGNKAREGKVEDIRLCIACNQGCWDSDWGIGVINCTQNPAACKESSEYAAVQPATVKKKVLVIGGGPGGMEAARVAAMRGHKVTLYEKEQQLGGQINTLTNAPGREEFSNVTRYFSAQLPKLGVKVKLGVEATPETVLQAKADVVILATGSKPNIDHIPGSNQANVVTPSQVLNGEVQVGERVVVFDNTGLQEAPTVADFLAEKGKKIELITSYVTIGAHWGLGASGVGSHIPIIWARLKKNGVNITTFTTVKKISGKTVTVADVWSGQESTLENIDTLVMATGYRSNRSLYYSLKGKVPELYEMGDCASPRRALDAIHEAYRQTINI
jgi:2,4-dienoyl-CoA reductase-like NADH-dependent reductase (Old Yellow Enzyme family)/thioredoxin reductase